MTGKRRIQVLVLGAAAIALAALTVLRRDASPAAQVAQPPRPAPAEGTAASRALALPAFDIRLERLKADRAELIETARNPFRFQQVAAAAEPARLAAAAQPPVPTAPVAPAGPPPPAPITLKFIGVLDRAGGVKVAILSDSRGNVFYGKEGAIIDGRFQLLRIGVESADLAHADGRGRQTIRLSGQ